MKRRAHHRGFHPKSARDPERPPFICSAAGNQGRDPDTCTHGARIRGIAVWATDEVKRVYDVPPSERAVCFMPNPDGDWRACTLCGSLLNPNKQWIIVESPTKANKG